MSEVKGPLEVRARSALYFQFKDDDSVYIFYCIFQSKIWQRKWHWLTEEGRKRGVVSSVSRFKQAKHLAINFCAFSFWSNYHSVFSAYKMYTVVWCFFKQSKYTLAINSCAELHWCFWKHLPQCAFGSQIFHPVSILGKGRGCCYKQAMRLALHIVL